MNIHNHLQDDDGKIEHFNNLIKCSIFPVLFILGFSFSL